MNRYGLQTVMKLASCYGLKSSAQGSGKKQFVVVRPVEFCPAVVTSSLSIDICVDQLTSAWIRLLEGLQ